MPESCPLCQVSLAGAEIPIEHREFYGGHTHYSRTILVEVRGVYDGGLYFRCPDCGGAWHRWTPGDWRYDCASPIIARHNALLTTAPPRVA